MKLMQDVPRTLQHLECVFISGRTCKYFRMGYKLLLNFTSNDCTL